MWHNFFNSIGDSSFLVYCYWDGYTFQICNFGNQVLPNRSCIIWNFLSCSINATGITGSFGNRVCLNTNGVTYKFPMLNVVSLLQYNLMSVSILDSSNTLLNSFSKSRFLRKHVRSGNVMISNIDSSNSWATRRYSNHHVSILSFGDADVLNFGPA